MAKETKVTPEVVEYVKKLAKGDLVTLFEGKNPFTDDKGKPLTLPSDTLEAIANGDFDHLLQEDKKEKASKKKSDEKKSDEKKSDEKKSDDTKSDEKKSDDTKSDEKKSDEKKSDEEDDKNEKSGKKSKIKAGKKPKSSSRPPMSDLKKRGILAACVIVPLVIVAIVFQEEIRQVISEVAKSFAVVAAVLSVGFCVPFAMDVSVKKGLRMLGFFAVAVGFYLLSLGGAFITAVATLAVGIMILMLAF